MTSFDPIVIFAGRVFPFTPIDRPCFRLTAKQSATARSAKCTHVGCFWRGYAWGSPRVGIAQEAAKSGYTVHILGSTHPHCAGELGTITLGLTPMLAAEFHLRLATTVAKRGTEKWQRIVHVPGAGYRCADPGWPFAATCGQATRYTFEEAVAMRDALRAAKIDATVMRLRPRAAPKTTIVFVYGSLLRGLANHRVIEAGLCGCSADKQDHACRAATKRGLPYARFLGETTTLPSYTMISLGAYPGLLLGGTTAIRGECYAVNDAQLARLDHLEGHPNYYRRTRIDAIGYPTAVGYVMPHRSMRFNTPVVTEGDWRAYHTEPHTDV